MDPSGGGQSHKLSVLSEHGLTIGHGAHRVQMDVPRRLEDAREGLNIRSWLSVYQRDRSGGVCHMHADSGSEAGLGNASR